MNCDDQKVGVIGLGSVGHAVVHGLSEFYDCELYDIKGNYDWANILDTSIVFVCVSTPEGLDGHLDCQNIDDVLKRLAADKYLGLIAIKSTIKIGFMEEATAKYPELRLVYMPEFLREKSNFTWFMDPDRLVLSGSSNDIEEVLSYFSWVKNVPILKMDYRSAEIAKLAHNAYIATKVSFTNQMEIICNEKSANAFDVMSVIWADRRVLCKEHLQPNMGVYGGKCVPKDTKELIVSSSNSILLRSVEEINEKFSENGLNVSHVKEQDDSI